MGRDTRGLVREPTNTLNRLNFAGLELAKIKPLCGLGNTPACIPDHGHWGKKFIFVRVCY